MIPAPVDTLERALWDAQLRLTEARAGVSQGAAVHEVAQQARELVAQYVRGSAQHRAALGRFVRRLASEAEWMDTEIKRLKGQLEEAEADRRRFRAYITNTMQEDGVTTIKGDGVSFSLTRAAQEVRVANARNLPTEFVDVTPERIEVRERRLVQALRDGQRIPGAELLPAGQTLVIR
jgi:hypothetical protein